MMRVLKYFTRHFKRLLFILSFSITLLVGVVRYLTGTEWALSLLYLFPILFVTWFIGRWAGIVISIISALSWLVADLLMIHSFSNPLIPFLNEIFRLIVFLIFTIVLSKFKKAFLNHKELARIDPLTGIANRRTFFELADREINRMQRYNRSFSVAYIDLDNFKPVNDSFGHDEGDILLSIVAKTITNNIRAIDVVARLGGDEFVILLSEIGDTSAYSVVRKLQKELLNIMKKNGWPVTFSIGLVTFNIPPNSVNEILKETDALMYAAKQGGKNMIMHNISNFSKISKVVYK